MNDDNQNQPLQPANQQAQADIFIQNQTNQTVATEQSQTPQTSAITPASTPEPVVPEQALLNQSGQQVPLSPVPAEYGIESDTNTNNQSPDPNQTHRLSRFGMGQAIYGLLQNKQLLIIIGIIIFAGVIGASYFMMSGNEPKGSASSSNLNGNDNVNADFSSLRTDSYSYNNISNSSMQSGSDFGNFSNSATANNDFLYDPFYYLDNSIVLTIGDPEGIELSDKPVVIDMRVTSADELSANIVIYSRDKTTCPEQTLKLPNNNKFICGNESYLFKYSSYDKVNNDSYLYYGTQTELNSVIGVLATLTPSAASGQLDCGVISTTTSASDSIKDKFCFASRAKSCSAAKLVSSVGVFGSSVTTESSVFKAADQRTCILQTKYLSSPLNPTHNDKSMTCAIDYANKNYESANLEAINDKQCRGELWNLIYNK